MILAWLLLLTGLTISAVAIYYSVIGLAAIFAAATIPIYIMGGSLEIAKLVCASWLKENWSRAPALMKWYMTTAVVVLMIITSMGIFGFLSKAHSDQSLVSGDVQSRIAVYDERIKTAKENIDANRKALKQMDEAVDQVMARSSSETGADKAVAIRRSQQKERARLQSEIQAEQKVITAVSQERAPIAAEVRKVEAEVGPIKYIAAFVYGDNSDANLLEKAVTWVIIIIVSVFDPLAVIMLLAAQMTFGWLREQKNKAVEPIVSVPQPDYEPDDGPLTDQQITQIKESVSTSSTEPITCYKCNTELVNAPGIGLFCPNKECDVLDNTKGVEWKFEPVAEKSIFEQHPYLNQPFSHFKNLKPMVHKPEEEKKEDDFEFLAKYEEITPQAAPVTADSTSQTVDEPKYQIFPELDEESKKKTTYMIKDQGQQIIKEK